MAVVANERDSVLVVTYQIGTELDGSPILRTRSFSNVKADALDQDIYDVANALYGLQENPLINVRRDKRADLTNV